MRRRDFVTSSGVALVGTVVTSLACSLSAHAQQRDRMRRIGVLMSFAEGDPAWDPYLAPNG